MFSAFNPSKCTHTWSSGQPTLRHPGSSQVFCALLKSLTSVVDNSCRRRDSNPQPRVTSAMLYPLGHSCPLNQYVNEALVQTSNNKESYQLTDELSYYMHKLTGKGTVANASSGQGNRVCNKPCSISLNCSH